MRLQNLLDSRNKHDMLIVAGDINAKVGEEKPDYEFMGRHGLGKRNGNGEKQ